MSHPADRYIDRTADGYEVEVATDDNEAKTYSFGDVWEARQFVRDEIMPAEQEDEDEDEDDELDSYANAKVADYSAALRTYHSDTLGAVTIPENE